MDHIIRMTLLDTFKRELINEEKGDLTIEKYIRDVSAFFLTMGAVSYTHLIFDLVISRNVLWNLEQPEQAYREWLRVLKPNGTVMNFDGNFYYYVTDAEYGDRTRWEHKHMQGINANSIDRIGEHLPMARRLRPEWDVQELQKLGAKDVCSHVTNEKILEDGHHMILNFQVSAVKAQV